MVRRGKRRKMKILPGILFSILLSSMLLSTFNIQSVKAAGTIYINADGSISPPQAPISSLDNITYTLTGNVTDSIVVQRSNIIVDGAGYTVEGDGTGNGFSLQNVVNVTIKNTRIEGCIDGIQLFNSANSIITGNRIVGNSYEGVGLYYSSDNIITGNSITNNQVGIGFYSSSSNSIFHNIFTNNAHQVYTETSVNNWDNGYPSGGNYWSDYLGIDSNGDGIGDTPYIIDENNQDRYPLMKPWTNIAISNISPSKKIVGEGTALQIHISVQNQGWKIENLNITIHANANVIETRQVTLDSGALTTITVAWDTSGFAKGNYTIWAYAWPVQGETDVADNTLVDGVVYVGIPGDVNGDGIVEMIDFYVLSIHFGHAPPNGHAPGTWAYTECYNADINNDGMIEMMDFYIASQNFMKTNP
jgi:parallel beta-helix repeat protein